MKPTAVKTITEHLDSFGIKPSVQRIEIMGYLLNTREHPTVDDIYTALLPKMPTLSRTTVYNTLKHFVEKEAVIFLGIDEKSARYDAFTHDHSHFRCKECDRVFDFPAVSIQILAPNEVSAFQVNHSYQYFHGICPNCIEKKRN